MYFLLQIIEKADGTYTQGTSQYADMTAAKIQFHTAMASAMQKDYLKATCVILNENGIVQKSEVYEAPSENVSDDSADAE